MSFLEVSDNVQSLPKCTYGKKLFIVPSVSTRCYYGLEHDTVMSASVCLAISQVEALGKKNDKSYNHGEKKSFVVCSKCNLYMIDAQGYTRKDENTLVKEPLPVGYCPKCGSKLNGGE